jgi:hypothetical protein
MRSFWLLLLSLALAYPGSRAFAQDVVECPSYPDVPINITTQFDDPTFDYSQNIAAIQRLSSDTSHSIKEGLTLGLTRYDPVLEFRVPIREVSLASGLSCAFVDHVDVTIGYKNVAVFIASEIPEDSCGFNQVLAHEQKHINVNKQILAEYTPRIERELKEYLRLNGVFREQTHDYALSILQGKLHEILNGIIADMTQENMRRQQMIDTRAEYARVSASCGGQLSNIAARFLQGR